MGILALAPLRGAAVLGAWILVFSSGMTSESAFARARVAPSADHVPGEIVVQLKDSSREGVRVAIEALQRELGRSSIVDVRNFKTDATLYVLKISRDANLNQAILALKAEPSVQIAEPNFLYHSFEDGTPNDPDFSKTWGLRNTGQADAAGQLGAAGSDINILPLWKQGFKGSRNVKVAVIDTGIDWDHSDLKANLYTNPGEKGSKADNKKDDDGNGFIDDVHGWNFNKKDNNSRDDQNHGSHCAGTIGGVGGNGIGVTGVNWEVSLLPIKFLDSTGGGSLAGAIESINYATMMKVDLMSNSWGGGSFSEAMKVAIEKARDAGILFVAAAGNDGYSNDSAPTYPSSFEVSNILSVAATDNRDSLAKFSNFGKRSVHVAAPGVKIYSTTKDGKYDHLSGTSMATPHVAGIAALLLSAEPTLSFAQIKDRLIKTSDPVRGPKRKIAAQGRVNAYQALYNVVPPSPEPDASLWKSEVLVVESEHPYKNGESKTFTVSRPGAKYIRIHFEKVEVENNYDKILIQNATGTEVYEEITGTVSDYTAEYVEGDTAVIALKVDESNAKYGFKVDRVDVIY